MTKFKFEVGDKVRRIRDQCGCMPVGMVDVVENLVRGSCENFVILKTVNARNTTMSPEFTLVNESECNELT